MGDVIHALPAIATLKSSFPDAHLTWVVRERWMPLLEANPFIDQLIPFERTMRGMVDLRSRLRSQRFDLAVDLQGLIQSAMISAASRANKIYGFDRSQVAEKLASMFYTHRVVTKATHVVDQNLEIVAAAGATNIIREFAIPEGSNECQLPSGKYVLTSPLAGWKSKQWPAERFAELASRLGMPLVVNGPPEAASELRAIRGAHVHLSSLAGLIDATRRAHAVIGVDSGPMHLAAALSKPGVAIFGATDPARNGPYGGSLQVLRNAGAMTTYKRDAGADDMLAITADAVAEALRASQECRA